MTTKTVQIPAELLEEIYQWLTEGDMCDWDKRCTYHEKLGKILDKPPVIYPTE